MDEQHRAWLDAQAQQLDAQARRDLRMRCIEAAARQNVGVVVTPSVLMSEAASYYEWVLDDSTHS